MFTKRGLLSRTQHNRVCNQTKKYRGISTTPDSVLETIDQRHVFDTSVYHPDASTLEYTATMLGNAARKHGFLFVKGTPVSALLPYLHACNDWLLQQSPEALQSITTENAQRGYHMFEGSPFASSDSQVEGCDTKDHIQAYTVQNPWRSEESLRDVYDDLVFTKIEQVPNHCEQVEEQETQNILHRYTWLLSKEVGYNKPSNVGSVYQGAHRDTQATNTYTKWPKNALFRESLYSFPPVASEDASMLTYFTDYTSHQPPFPFTMSPTLFTQIYTSYYAACTATSQVLTRLLLQHYKVSDQVQDMVSTWHNMHAHTLEMKCYADASKVHLSNQARTSLQHSSEINTQAIADVQLRFPIHSDLTTLTLLTQNNGEGGLLLQDTSKQWLSIPYKADAVIVNTGDFLQAVTDSFYPSTQHCVVSKEEAKQRTSTVFFYQPNMHAKIQSLREEHAFAPFLAGDRYPYI